jgi:transposase-like protein
MKIDDKKLTELFTQGLSIRKIAKELNCSPAGVHKRIKTLNLKVNTETESEHEETREPKEEPKRQNVYLFGGKVSYIPPYEPSQRRKSEEIRVKVRADNIVDALKKAELEIKRHSNGFEFSLMTLFGSTVTVYPPRKKE